MHTSRVTNRQRLMYTFMVSGIIGGLLFTSGIVTVVHSIQTLIGTTLVSGLVLGICYRNLFENKTYCGIPFYEFSMKLKMENGRSELWYHLLTTRAIGSVMSFILIVATLYLPCSIQMAKGEVSTSYLICSLFIYLKVVSLILSQIKGSIQIMQRAKEVDESIGIQN